MAGIKWCCKQKLGIKLIEQNENLANAYLKMAENSLGTMNREKEKNLSFAIVAGYYSMYYSLYAVLMKLGIKCEIHSCSLELMKFSLSEHYSDDDRKTIKTDFDARIIAQYYADKVVDREDADYIFEQAPLFLSNSGEVLSRLNYNEIKEIRDKILEVADENTRFI